MLSDYNAKNYTEQEGEKTHIEGTLDIESGGALDVKAGGAIKIAGTAITADAAEINKLDGMTTTKAELNFLTGLTNTVAKINTAGVWEREIYVEACAAGVDITARTLYIAPSGFKVSLASANIVPCGSFAGIDAGNSSVWTLLNGTDEIVSKTFDDSPAFPADGVDTTIGALSATYKDINAGEALKLTVTNAATAATPIVVLRLYGIIEKV